MDRVWVLGVSLAVGLGLCVEGARGTPAAEPTRPTDDANQLAALWEDLGSAERPKVSAAAIELLAKDDRAVKFLNGKLNVRKSTPVDPKRVARLIRGLDSDEWRKREEAQKGLLAIGPVVGLFLREALQKDPSLEVKTRAETILAELAARASGSPDAHRARWGVIVLGQIASPKALAALLSLRGGPNGSLQWRLPGALFELAERAIPPLVDRAGRQAAAGNAAAAAEDCAEALAIAEKTGHYSQGRVRAILTGLRDGAKAKRGGALAPAAISWTAVRGENLLGNDGFEAKRWLGSWPTEAGIWGGDHADMVAAERGVKPREGKGMIRFGATNFRSAGSSNAAQIVQVIDISRFRKVIASGKARAVASVFFNRVSGDAQTDTAFSMSLISYAGPPTAHFSMGQQHRWLSRRVAALRADANPKGWQKLALRASLPKNTDFLVIELQAVEDIHNDTRSPEFDGHYADSAFVTIVTTDPADKGADLIPTPPEVQPPPAKPPVPRPANPPPFLDVIEHRRTKRLKLLPKRS